jgi:dTDP-4-amino-4,6-dideoxygalactose transaminase
MKWRVALSEPDLGDAEIDALTRVIRSKWLTMGDLTSEFERRFAEFVGCKHALAVNSCTAALHVALTAANVGPADEVICPALTFVATANAILYVGARPVFADVESRDCWNVSRDTIDAVATSATKAVIVVHYGGYPCDMAAITAWARDRGVAVIEDAAHAPGASVDGRNIGNWGDFGCFSFFSNKNMTTAEGGMVTFNGEGLLERLRGLRSHGMTTVTLDRHRGHAHSYDVVDLGYNYRMSELNAALGLVQLDSVVSRNRLRLTLIEQYRESLSDIAGISIPFAQHPGVAAHHLMPILLPEYADRRRIMDRLREAGIQTSIHYRPIDTFTAYQNRGLGPCEHLPLTHAIGERQLTLPLYPSLHPRDVDFVCATLRDVLRGA